MQSADHKQIDDTVQVEVSDEFDALAWAEELCDRAQALHEEAAAEAAQIVSKAKADAARLVRHAMAVIDDNVARSEAARREQEMHRAAAQAALDEAEKILGQARAAQNWMAAEQLDIVDLTAPTRTKLSYGVLAELAR